MARKRIIKRKWVNVREDQPKHERYQYLKRELGKEVSKADTVWQQIVNEVKFNNI